MKKKFVSFLILACAIMSVGLVGSCKDYADDMVRDLELSQDKDTRDFKDSLKALRTTIKNNYNTLQARINQLEAKHKADSLKMRNELNNRIAALEGKESADSLAIMTALKNDTALIWARIRVDEAAHKADTSQLWNAIRNLENANDALEEALETANDSLSDVADTVAALITRFNQKIAAASANVQATADSAWELADSIRGAIIGWDEKLEEAYVDANYALALAERDSARIDALEDTLGKYATIDTVLAIARENLKQANAYTDSVAHALVDSLGADITKWTNKQLKNLEKRLKEYVEDKIDPLRTQIKKNMDDIQALNDRIDEEVEALNEKIDAIKDIIKNLEEKRITSLLVQGVKTPAFGSFSLPIGIRSNILMAYYGEFDDVEFPTTATANFVGDLADQFTEDEASFLKFNNISKNYSNALNEDETEYNAGKFYLTVNPNNVALDDTYEFTLVNSKGVESKAVLGNLRPSEDQLTFGYTRATVDAADTENGFYEADVTIKAEDVEDLQPSLDIEDLKAIAKAAKNERSLISVTKSILNAMDGLLDANAVQVTWSDSLGDHKVKSGYDLAVAAVKPLSFHTSLGAISSRKLPADPIGDLLASLNVPSINLNITPINLNAGTLNFTAVNYNPAGAPTIHFQLEDNTGTPLQDLNGHNIEGDIDYTQMRNEITALVNDLNGELEDFNDDIEDLIDDIQDQVNNMLTEIQGQVKDEVDGMVDGIIDQVGSNAMVKRVNSLISRFNGFIDYADNLFDITLLYNGADNAVHPVSATKAIPTLFDGAGDYTLYVTN
ncbi:MAG: hypothetical protein IK006_09075, partial [Bacteroidaceae bacterium]|nr:hypothetical protein [Bacteroidaceae bacterium]